SPGAIRAGSEHDAVLSGVVERHHCQPGVGTISEDAQLDTCLAQERERDVRIVIGACTTGESDASAQASSSTGLVRTLAAGGASRPGARECLTGQRVTSAVEHKIHVGGSDDEDPARGVVVLRGDAGYRACFDHDAPPARERCGLPVISWRAPDRATPRARTGSRTAVATRMKPFPPMLLHIGS